jgi:hypothetical protein
MTEIIEVPGQIGRAVRAAKNASPERLSKLFAFLGAPGLVACLVYMAAGQPGTLFEPEYPLSVTALSSYTDGQGPKPHKAVAIIVEPARSDYALPLTWNTSKRIVSSLTSEEWARNEQNLTQNGNDLTLKLPLVGISRPVVILADGTPGAKLLIGGGEVPLDRLQLVGHRAINLAMWAFVSAMFGLGLGVATEDGPRENTSGEGAGAKDEH